MWFGQSFGDSKHNCCFFGALLFAFCLGLCADDLKAAGYAETYFDLEAYWSYTGLIRGPEQNKTGTLGLKKINLDINLKTPESIEFYLGLRPLARSYDRGELAREYDTRLRPGLQEAKPLRLLDLYELAYAPSTYFRLGFGVYPEVFQYLSEVEDSESFVMAIRPDFVPKSLGVRLDFSLSEWPRFKWGLRFYEGPQDSALELDANGSDTLARDPHRGIAIELRQLWPLGFSSVLGIAHHRLNSVAGSVSEDWQGLVGLQYALDSSVREGFAPLSLGYELRLEKSDHNKKELPDLETLYQQIYSQVQISPNVSGRVSYAQARGEKLEQSYKEKEGHRGRQYYAHISWIIADQFDLRLSSATEEKKRVFQGAEESGIHIGNQKINFISRYMLSIKWVFNQSRTDKRG